MKKRDRKHDEKFARDADEIVSVIDQDKFENEVQDEWHPSELENLKRQVHEQKSLKNGRVIWKEIEIPNRKTIDCMEKWHSMDKK